MQVSGIDVVEHRVYEPICDKLFEVELLLVNEILHQNCSGADEVLQILCTKIRCASLIGGATLAG